MTVRVGLVGAGPWAGMFTAPMLAAGPMTALSVIWARRAAPAQALASEHGAVAVPSLDDLLAECDAVAFAVAPDVQASLAPTAAAAGKHLLLEKPLGFTVEQAEAIAAAAQGAGIVTQMMLTNRYTRSVREFLTAVGDSTLHTLSAEFVSGAALPGSPFATPWRRAGNALLDVGPHVLDLVEAAAGPATVLTARDVGGCLAVTLQHKGGAVSQATLSITTPDAHGPLRCQALTDQGRVVLADPSTEPPESVQRAITDTFAHSIAAGRSPDLDVHRGLALQRLLDEVQRAAAAS
jgi:predicted dehydrogenase